MKLARSCENGDVYIGSEKSHMPTDSNNFLRSSLMLKEVGTSLLGTSMFSSPVSLLPSIPAPLEVMILDTLIKYITLLCLVDKKCTLAGRRPFSHHILIDICASRRGAFAFHPKTHEVRQVGNEFSASSTKAW